MNDIIVFLPGFMSDIRVWGAQVEAMARNHTIVMPKMMDLHSIEEMAQAVLDQSPEKFSIAGISLGAMVGLEVARLAPERVLRLALVGTNCLAETPPLAAERELRMARAKAGRFDEVLRDEWPDSCAAPGPYHDQVLEYLRMMATELGPTLYQSQSRALQRRPDQQRTLRQLRQPLLVLCGQHDSLYLPRRHEFIAALAQNAELQIVDGAGHAVPVEAPNAMTDALHQWMARAPVAPTKLT